jgi:RNA-directed DNA polymerase
MNLVQALCEDLVIPEGELWKFVLTIPRRYKKYTIPKRGSDKLRLIAQPSQEVKFIQRLLIDKLRGSLKIHSAAMAYEKNVGIRANALRHVENKFLLKMDFKDFFPSVTPELLFAITDSQNIRFEPNERILLEHALFWKMTRRSKLRLSVGAPSSPFISNFVMSNFDSNMAAYCFARGIVYTRYADDITFTSNTKGILFEIPDKVKLALKTDCLGKIKVNSTKTVFASKATNRHVTGLVLTNESKLSVGRWRKREISSLIHKFKLSLLDTEETLRLKGLIAFAIHIEPDFIQRMKNKYSENIISEIMRSDKHLRIQTN